MTQILGQFCINVRDIDRALEFWEGVCELELQHRTEIPAAFEAVLQSPHGGSRMQLAQQKDNDEPIDMGTAMWKLYVNTSDCQAVYDRAIAAGCESVTEPTKLDRWPVTIAFVKDYDGYLVEFVEHDNGT
ncbi:MAG: lactoylglutathione lyase, partial [Candidatus Aldehydirespiratoraceae bacterium]